MSQITKVLRKYDDTHFNITLEWLHARGNRINMYENVILATTPYVRINQATVPHIINEDYERNPSKSTVSDVHKAKYFRLL